MADLPGYTVLREPKGGPDAVLAGYEDEAALLTKAANYLSVQGHPCRIVLLPADVLFSNVSEEARTSLFPDRVPVTGRRAFGRSPDQSAEELANALLEALRV